MIPEVSHPAMDLSAFIGVILFAAIVGVVMSFVIMSFDDGKGRIIFRRVRCKIGRHRLHATLGSRRVAKMYCQDCKARRTDRNLRIM